MWDIERELVDAWFADNVQGTQNHDNLDLDLADAADASKDMLAIAVIDTPDVPSLSEDALFEAACPAFAEGSKVEFYSTTNKEWYHPPNILSQTESRPAYAVVFSLFKLIAQFRPMHIERLFETL